MNLLDGPRLALGLLTVLPAGAVRTDRRTARDAVLVAPLVGLLLGAVAWLVGAVVQLAGAGPLLSATASVGALAFATRGLHLDGLADLADGLGSGRPAEAALAVMRRSDAGPFGVITLVLVLLTQVAALEQAWQSGHAFAALLLSCATGRLALVWACRSSVPAARPDGLGALVAGTVPVPAAVGTTGLLLLVGGIVGGLTAGPGAAAAGAGAVLAGTVGALLLLRRAVHRLGGVTGDVLGAAVETAGTCALLLFVLAVG